MSDTGPFPDRSDRRRDLLTTRTMLVKVRDEHWNEGARSRAGILIANIDGLNKHPDDEALETQMRKNLQDFQNWMASLSTITFE